MTYLLDTDTLIYLIRGLKLDPTANERQRQRLQTARRMVSKCQHRQAAGDDIGLSAITVAELEYGARNSSDYEKEIAAVRKVLTPFTVHDFDAARCGPGYGEVRYRLEQSGAPIGAMDLSIAAHARALGATLVTNNMAHFARVPGLKCENWCQ